MKSKVPRLAFKACRDLPHPIFPAHLLALTVLHPLLAPSSLLQPSLPMRLLLAEYASPAARSGKCFRIPWKPDANDPWSGTTSYTRLDLGVGAAYALVSAQVRYRANTQYVFGRDQKVLVNRAGATFTWTWASKVSSLGFCFCLYKAKIIGVLSHKAEARIRPYSLCKQLNIVPRLGEREREGRREGWRDGGTEGLTYRLQSRNTVDN